MHNAENERIKRKYLLFLKEAKRQSEASLDAVAKALSRFEHYTRHRAFKAFRHEQAVGFKHHLAVGLSSQTGRPLAMATQYSTLNALRAFFLWLHYQPGFKSRFTCSDVEYFNLPAKESRIATTRRERAVPTLEQVRHVVTAMPADSEIELRNRALISLAILTGARDSALASLRLKHLNLAENVLEQDAKDVKTKNSKTMRTWFFPVGPPFREIVAQWAAYLVEQKLWGPEDPLFPATSVGHDENRLFKASGISRNRWSNADPVRGIFKAAWSSAGLPNFNPHSLRKTLTRLGEQMARTPEEFKAWSQNLGHEDVMTTLASYGAVEPRRQAEIIRALGIVGASGASGHEQADRFIEAVFRRLEARPDLAGARGVSLGQTLPGD